MSDRYAEFLDEKTHLGGYYGFDPVWMPDELFPFQRKLVEWACSKGRAAIFADCGMGKTPIQLTWAENVARTTGGRVLILAPLAVAFQTVREGEKFGVVVHHRRDGLADDDYRMRTEGGPIVVTNYERLQHFNPDDFQGVVCDESSILKNFDGATRQAVTDFMRKRPYRLLCTATAAPNDYIELGTSSEALGEIGSADMVSKFFRKSKKTTSARHERMAGVYELRPHASHDFWRWICSWSRALRKPSDLGYDDGGFSLPLLKVRQHVVKASEPRSGYLLDLPAVGLAEQRSDLSRTIDERCGMVADLINAHGEPAVAWCNLNSEGSKLTKSIDGAVEVSGADTEQHKEDSFRGFADGSIRVLVTKPTIGGFGLNWQHCAHMTFFPSHSYEQYYQCVRRCWRFGQAKPVTVDMITTDGQENVLRNLNRKSVAAKAMFENLVGMMQNELKITRQNEYTHEEEVPEWL